MQHILSYMRKAIIDYKMIQPGDRIAVGVSGGKDSVVLLTGLGRLQKFLGIPFEVAGITLDPQFGGKPCDYGILAEYFAKEEVVYHIKRTNIGEVVFDVRKESNPCSLCARMRRGALHDVAKELGFNKIALGHHRDDAAETFLMNLFHEGRIACFSPVSYLSRKDLTMIRPLAYAPERIIRNTAARLQMPIVKSQCPVDGKTTRQKTKEFIAQQEKLSPGFGQRIFGAMKRAGISGW